MVSQYETSQLRKNVSCGEMLESPVKVRTLGYSFHSVQIASLSTPAYLKAILSTYVLVPTWYVHITRTHPLVSFTLYST